MATSTQFLSVYHTRKENKMKHYSLHICEAHDQEAQTDLTMELT
jgi:hypothetical protein